MKITPNFTYLFFLFLCVQNLNAQIPKEVPHPDNNSPIDFNNFADIIIYVILPLVFIVLYFIARKKRRKK